MPRAKHEKHKRPAEGPAQDHTQPTAQQDLSDSGLGLLPVANHQRRDAADVLGPDRDDARLGLVPGGVPPGSAFAEQNDGMMAGRQHRTEIIAEEPDLTTTPHELGDDDSGYDVSGIDARMPNLEPSFTDQPLLTDPMAAVGGRDALSDPVAEGDDVYVPAMDPVTTTNAHGETEVLGGFSLSASEQITPPRSASDGQIGDEAIADAVRAALQQDAATTDLDIRVTVRRGIVHLHGSVADLDDADNAEEVARRVEGIVDVAEELEVTEV
jgi:hypothetical protein